MDDKLEEIRRRLAEIHDELPEQVAKVEALVAEHQALTDELTRLTEPPKHRFQIIKGGLAAFVILAGLLARLIPRRATVAAASATLVAGTVVLLALGAPPRLNEGAAPSTPGVQPSASSRTVHTRRRSPSASASPSPSASIRARAVVQLAALPAPKASTTAQAAAPGPVPTSSSPAVPVANPSWSATSSSSPGPSVAPSQTPSIACLLDLEVQPILEACLL